MTAKHLSAELKEKKPKGTGGDWPRLGSAILELTPCAVPAAKASQKEYEKNHEQVAQLKETLGQLEVRLTFMLVSMLVCKPRQSQTVTHPLATQAELAALDYAPETEATLRQATPQLQQARQRLADQVDQLSARLAALEFRYSDPHPGFDRSKVKGLVAELVTVKDEASATALEVAAGSKLYQVRQRCRLSSEVAAFALSS